MGGEQEGPGPRVGAGPKGTEAAEEGGVGLVEGVGIYDVVAVLVPEGDGGGPMGVVNIMEEDGQLRGIELSEESVWWGGAVVEVASEVPEGNTRMLGVLDKHEDTK